MLLLRLLLLLLILGPSPVLVVVVVVVFAQPALPHFLPAADSGSESAVDAPFPPELPLAGDDDAHTHRLAGEETCYLAE